MENKVLEKRNFYNNDDSGKSYIFAILASLLVSLLFSFIASGIASGSGTKPENITGNVWFKVFLSFAGELSFLLVFFVYNKIYKINNTACRFKVKLNPDKKKSILTYFMMIVIAGVVLFGLNYFISCVDELLKVIGFPLSTTTGLPLDTFGWFVLNVFLIAVMPAFCEELLFRGIIFNGLRRNFSDKVAIVLSALLFAIMHGNPQQLVFQFFLGIILAWVVLRTGSIVSSIIVHFTNNFLTILFAYLKSVAGVDLGSFTNVWWYYIMSFGLIFVVGLIIWLFDKYYFKKQNYNDVEKEPTARKSLFVWISLLVGVIILIINTIILV